jgi:hypothetical protein
MHSPTNIRISRMFTIDMCIDRQLVSVRSQILRVLLSFAGACSAEMGVTFDLGLGLHRGETLHDSAGVDTLL